MIEALQGNIFAIILALVTTGTISVLIKLIFSKPTTLSLAKKTDAEAAVILLEGWQKIAETLKEQMRDMETRYENRIVAFERNINIREQWYTENLAARDRKIERLQEQLYELKRKLSLYEVTQSGKDRLRGVRLESAKTEIRGVVDDALEDAKQ